MSTSANIIILKDQNCYDVGEDRIEYMNAKNLLVSNRIDLVVKYKFVEAYDNGLHIPFIQELYYAHLEAFTGGSFVEPGKEESKKSFEDYLTIFQRLIEDIRDNGIKKEISVIPVGKNNTILNGSHRVAIAMYYNLTIPIVRYEDIEVKYDFCFFQKNLLERRYLDYIVTEYIRLKSNVFFACIWPEADRGRLGKMDKAIKEVCDVVYASSASLTYNGLKNLMIQIYGEQPWCGNIQNGYKGVQSKADLCYAGHTETLIYVLDGTDLPAIVRLKQEIRDIFQIGNSSVHISDNSWESLCMAQLLLNSNSIDLLNIGNICKCKNYIQKIYRINRELEDYKLNKEDFLIDSSGVLGVYGIRDPEDIDCLTYIDLNRYDFSEKIIMHDESINYYFQPKEELLYNPVNYLYAYGIKFCSLPALFEMKKRRNEKKDRDDCALMKPFMGMQIDYKYRIKQYSVRWKRNGRNVCRKIKGKVCAFLKILHLYDFAEKIYRLIKGHSHG